MSPEAKTAGEAKPELVKEQDAAPAKDPTPAKAEQPKPNPAEKAAEPHPKTGMSGDPVPRLNSSELLAELLDDAKRVAAYGQRTGRLPDTDLIFALAAVERGITAGSVWDDPAIISLQAALNRAIGQIYPTTLADLRDPDWKPFSRRPEMTLGHIAFVVFSLLLMGLSAFWTVHYNEGNEVIRGLQALQKEDPQAEIGSIVRQIVRAVPPTGITGSTATTLAEETYFKLLDKISSYDARYQFYAPQVETFLESNLLPHDVAARFLTGVAGYFTTMGTGNAVAAPAMSLNDPNYKDYDACATESDGTRKPRRPVSAEFSTSAVGKMLLFYAASTTDILCVYGVHYMPFNLPPIDRFMQNVQQWSNALGLWYLPALYGMLGATLFYMRRVLDPTVPDPPFTRVLHRLALGAFAGVIITWFWVPNTQLAEGFTSVGLTLFTLAFLVGFCVDVLFALLDRLVTLLLDLVKGVSRQAKPATVPAVVVQTTSK